MDEINVYTRTWICNVESPVFYKPMSGALVEQPIAAYPHPPHFLYCFDYNLRSLHSTFELSSFFATMEEEIPPVEG